MKLSPHFSLSELTVTQTGLNNTPTEVEIKRLTDHAWLLERVRFLIGNKPIIINSGFRNEKVNRAVGGVPNSDHRLGYASDFRVTGMTPRQIVDIIRNAGFSFDQVIDENGRWVHFSTNPRNRGEVMQKRNGRYSFI